MLLLFFSGGGGEKGVSTCYKCLVWQWQLEICVTTGWREGRRVVVCWKHGFIYALLLGRGGAPLVGDLAAPPPPSGVCVWPGAKVATL